MESHWTGKIGGDPVVTLGEIWSQSFIFALGSVSGIHVVTPDQ